MRIMMFYRDNITYDIVNYFIDLMARGLIRLGVDVDIFDILGDNRNEESVRLACALRDYHYDAAYTVDAVGQQSITDENGKCIYDTYGIPFFNRLIDPPYFLDISSKAKDYYILFTDRNYIDFTKKYYPEVKDAFFFPHFASSDFYGETQENYVKRKYDIVFTGSYESIEKMTARFLDPMPQTEKMIFFDALDILLDAREMSVEDALIKAFKDRTGTELTSEQYKNVKPLFSYLNVFMRQYFREELLRTLAAAGITINIWGGGNWEDADWVKDSPFIFHGRCEAAHIPEIYRQSRIVLNCFPCFKGGSHDRLPIGMINGAAVMTDRNKYTDSIADSEEKFIYYDISHTEKAPGILFDMLDEPEKLYGKAVNGWKYASENMSSERAAAEFLNLVNRVK